MLLINIHTSVWFKPIT